MIVGMGGGKGLSRTLLALKKNKMDFGAVVETTDNGGSTGKLRREFNVPAMGDIRRVVDTVSESPFAESMEYRFNGHAVGNLVLLKLMKLHGFSSAVQIYRKAMGLDVPIEPLFEEACDLVAHFNGNQIVGEVQVDATEGRIESMDLKPKLSPNPNAVDLIEEADALVVGPGSLFTSVLPHFLADEVRKAACSVPTKIYIVNILNDVSPVKGFKVSDYLKALEKIGGFKPDHIVVQSPPKGVEVDVASCVGADLAEGKHWHSPEKLGEVLCQLLH